MVKDAESHAEDDRRQRELAEARNVAENAAYQAEKQLDDMGDKVESSAKDEITKAIADVRESLTLRERRARSRPRPTRSRPPSTRSPSRSTRRRPREQAQAAGDGASADGAGGERRGGGRRRRGRG